jgi:hypothetical protein
MPEDTFKENVWEGSDGLGGSREKEIRDASGGSFLAVTLLPHQKLLLQPQKSGAAISASDRQD